MAVSAAATVFDRLAGDDPAALTWWPGSACSCRTCWP